MRSKTSETKSSRVPKLRRQRRKNGADTAFVELGEQRVYLGVYGSAESRQRYAKIILEWETHGRHLPVAAEAVTVAELVARFWGHAEEHYGAGSVELANFRRIMRLVAEPYGACTVQEFGPRALRAVRAAMIRKGWCRAGVNHSVNRIRHVFRWGVEQELCPPGTWQTLTAVRGLQRGHTEAPDNPPKMPVAETDIEAVRPHVSRQVWALVQLQLLTGARGGEIVGLRAVDIDTSEPVWCFRPTDHKTAHHGHGRVIWFGPRAQEVLSPFMTGRPVDRPLFSPREAEAERYADAPTHRREDQLPSPVLTDRTVGDVYTRDSYRRAIDRACRLAKIEPWSPHRLRHTAATNFRKQFGVENAKVLLGHSTLSTTLLYAEDDQTKAVEVARKIG